VHAGIVTAIGCAALSLLPEGAEVLTVEYKVDFLAPAHGTRLIARGRVIRPGRTISVSEGEVLAVSGDTEVRVIAMLATMIRSDTQTWMRYAGDTEETRSSTDTMKTCAPADHSGQTRRGSAIRRDATASTGEACHGSR
jgi:uncharacterized protein (TIGR00369 family)